MEKHGLVAFMRGVAALVLSLFVSGVLAQPLTYNVALPVGSGAINGFITTDGQIGALSYTDLIDWNLSVTGPAPNGDLVAVTLTKANSHISVFSHDLTSTPSQLLFDFDGGSDPSSGQVVFGMNVAPPPGQHGAFICLEAVTCGFAPAHGVSFGIDTNGNFQFTAHSGIQPIGTVAAVPESESYILMLLGLGLIFIFVRPQRGRRLNCLSVQFLSRA